MTIKLNPGDRIEGTRLCYLVEIAKVNPKRRRALFLCDCGNTLEADLAWVRHLNTRSCGCFRKEVTSAKNYKHGQAERSNASGSYRSWQAMHQRVLVNPDYIGKRFICERWSGEYGFINFYADMGDRPEGMTLDRINNQGHYEPGNCRWATHYEQVHNRG